MTTPSTASTSSRSAGLFIFGVICLLVGLVATGFLVAHELAGAALPGCGPGSGCDRAAQSAWAEVPGVDWPVSFLGLAYFAAMTIGWLVSWRRATIGSGLKVLAVVAAAASLMYLIVMIAGGYVCKYCLATHLANFAFLIAILPLPRPAGAARGSFAAAGLTFLVVTAGILVADITVKRQAAQTAEKELAESTRQVVAGNESSEGFTGRYLFGPEKAAIRIVMFTDFQCRDCNRLGPEAHELAKSRDDVLLSIKHFPLDNACNHYLSKSMHPNACDAAKAAEAAGILHDDKGFYQVAEWLYARGGRFSRSQLDRAVREFGFDPAKFHETMNGPEVMERIKADIDEAKSLGLHYTPMIFINGVELRGWRARNAVSRAVSQVAASNPAAAEPTQDVPPTAVEKYIRDWREQPTRTIRGRNRAWRLRSSEGQGESPVKVVLWGDYEVPMTAEADKQLRAIVADRDDVVYTYRHFPIHKSCNPFAWDDLHPHACFAARAVEAVSKIAGDKAFWQMHEALIELNADLSEEAILNAAEQIGLDREEVAETMQDPEIDRLIFQDAQAAKSAGVRGVPKVFINNKLSPRWRLEGREILRKIVEEAADSPRNR